MRVRELKRPPRHRIAGGVRHDDRIGPEAPEVGYGQAFEAHINSLKVFRSSPPMAIDGSEWKGKRDRAIKRFR
jgi:hypothetical protein